MWVLSVERTSLVVYFCLICLFVFLFVFFLVALFHLFTFLLVFLLLLLLLLLLFASLFIWPLIICLLVFCWTRGCAKRIICNIHCATFCKSVSWVEQRTFSMYYMGEGLYCHFYNGGSNGEECFRQKLTKQYELHEDIKPHEKPHTHTRISTQAHAHTHTRTHARTHTHT